MGGGAVRFPFLCKTIKRSMVDKSLVENVVNEHLTNSSLFLVSVKVSKNNVVIVTIDGDEGVKVNDCIELSRFIESKLDRNKEDFELTITSFGLEEYFTLQRQYKKNIGENVEVVLLDDTKINGVLSKCEDDKIEITNKRQKSQLSISFNEIKKTRMIINF